MNIRLLSTVIVVIPITVFVGASAQRDGAIADTSLLQATQPTTVETLLSGVLYQQGGVAASLWALSG